MLDRQTDSDRAHFGGEPFGPRQTEVLEAALSLLVEGGERGLTTAGLARKANCSKESLYKWFGDRDGLLAAMITFQASKVREPEIPAVAMKAEVFRAQLEGFAEDLLTVLSGPTSLALNRMAIGQASREGSKLGNLLVTHGRHAVEDRGVRLLQAGRAAGHLIFDDRDEAFRTFYGLIVGELHVRMLLGDRVPPLEPADGIATEAHRAADHFCRLYGSGEIETTTSKGRN